MKKKLLALERNKIWFKYICNWFCDKNKRITKRKKTKQKLTLNKFHYCFGKNNMAAPIVQPYKIIDYKK